MAKTSGDKTLDQVLMDIEKQFGKGAVMKLGDNEHREIDVVSSGSISLDVALGIGGYPKGRIIEIFGPESSGKTTFALHAIAEIQKKGGRAAFIDAEHALDPQYAAKIGVNINDLLLSQPDNGEQALEICEALVRSGAIGISLQKKLNCKVTLADINPKCVKIIKKNAKKMQANVKVLKSDMLKNIKQTFDLIVCNPPYIKTADIKTLDASVKNFEPHLALDGGNDGLRFYKTLANSSHKFLKPNGILALEIGWGQANDVAKLLNENFEQIEIQKDYSNLDRFIFAKRR